MRLTNVPPDQLTDQQRVLFESIHAGIGENLQGYVTRLDDGTLVGPFNALLRFPTLGTAVWDLCLALFGETVLPPLAREVVILLTGARWGSMYEIYSHEALARSHGLSATKIATLAAGERPIDLTDEEVPAFDLASVLLRGHQAANSTYERAVAAYGDDGVAEIAVLIGCYTTICTLLNTFDVDLPGTEIGASATERTSA